MGRKLETAAALTTAAAVICGVGVWWRRDRYILAGYPPFDIPKPICDNLWIVDSEPISAMGLTIPVRMTVVRFTNGDLLLHSPTRHTPELAKQLEALGSVRNLVAPSIAHWEFLKEWQIAFPEATTWAVPGLRDRRPVQRAGIRLDHDLGQVPPESWADELQQGLVDAGKFREVYFFHAPSRTLLLTDLIDNLNPAKLPFGTALLARMSLASDGTTPLHVRMAISLAGRRPVEAIRDMLDLAPARVIFAHGCWFEQNGEDRLERAFAWLPKLPPQHREKMR